MGQIGTYVLRDMYDFYSKMLFKHIEKSGYGYICVKTYV